MCLERQHDPVRKMPQESRPAIAVRRCRLDYRKIEFATQFSQPAAQPRRIVLVAGRSQESFSSHQPETWSKLSGGPAQFAHFRLGLIAGLPKALLQCPGAQARIYQ